MKLTTILLLLVMIGFLAGCTKDRELPVDQTGENAEDKTPTDTGNNNVDTGTNTGTVNAPDISDADISVDTGTDESDTEGMIEPAADNT